MTHGMIIIRATARREMKIEDACPYSMDLLWTGADGKDNRQNIFEQHSGMLRQCASL